LKKDPSTSQEITVSRIPACSFCQFYLTRDFIYSEVANLARGEKKKLASKFSQRINKKKTPRRLVEQHIQNKICERVDQESRKNSAKNSSVEKAGYLLVRRRAAVRHNGPLAMAINRSLEAPAAPEATTHSLEHKALVSLALVSIAPSMLVPIWNGLSTDRSGLE
jgi:hypothetical protein